MLVPISGGLSHLQLYPLCMSFLSGTHMVFSFSGDIHIDLTPSFAWHCPQPLGRVNELTVLCLGDLAINSAPHFQSVSNLIYKYIFFNCGKYIYHKSCHCNHL